MTSILRINSAGDLQKFVQNAESDTTLAPAVEELLINIDGPFPTATLRHCISLTHNILDLFLQLPEDCPVDMLNGLRCPQLEFLQTNLPHRHLLSFINLNMTLVDISLSACHRPAAETCPLRLLDVRPYTGVECPSDCALGVVHPKLYRLTMQELQGLLSSAPTVLRTLRPPLIALSRLTLDFSPNDYDILESIIPVAPRLEKLKLLEKPRATRRRDSARRAWNHTTAWAGSLFKLDMLEEVALRTASTLVVSPASIVREKKTLLSWITATPRKAGSSKRSFEHPTLFSLRVWYRSQDPDHGILTLWSKTCGVWENISRQEKPAADTLF